MARKRSSSGDRTDKLLRDVFSPSILSEPRLQPLRGLEQARAVVKAVEDRRTFHPLRDLRPAGSLSKASRRIVVSHSTPNLARGLHPPPGLSFSVPRDVAVCVRRKERREVLFAKGKQGKGARSPRRRNRFSDIGC